MKMLRLGLAGSGSLLLVWGYFIFLHFSGASAATNGIIIVDTLQDERNHDGDCSLREAIHAANLNIKVDACEPGELITDTIHFNVSGTIPLTEELSIINGGPLVIDAGETITISGEHNVRVFFIHPGSKVNLHSLTITQGNAPDGGGVWNTGSLTIDKCILSSNNADSTGGGIFNDSGTLLLIDNTLSGNSAAWGAAF
jgi:CSLREA domain-containing protein